MQSDSPIKTLDSLKISQSEENIYFGFTAKSFLHHQVRNITGTLAFVGARKWHPDNVKTVLEAVDRSAAGPTAPAHGLYLVGVDYQTF